MNVDISQPREFRVSRVHPPDMTSERHLPPARVVRVIEVVVSLRVSADRGVIDFRRERQRRATAPAANELGGEQFAFFLGAAMRLKESIEGADAGLIFAKADKGAVATENVRLRHRQWNSRLAGISEDELTGLNRPSLPG